MTKVTLFDTNVEILLSDNYLAEENSIVYHAIYVQAKEGAHSIQFSYFYS